MATHVATKSPQATYADLEAVPAHLVAEILFGELVTHPRPVPAHSITAISLAEELVGPFQKSKGGPGGWIFMTEPELHLGADVVVPDLAGWRRERLHALPETAWIETAPDWVCEILSPATEKYDRGEKRLIYAAAGVNYLWLVDPRPQALEAFELTEGKWLLLATLTGGDAVSVAPFDVIEFSLQLLWPFEQPAADDAAGENPANET